jgi:histidinol-phosphate/aromatic aminotransferase/cobyric acid decarboxylase-like protein
VGGVRVSPVLAGLRTYPFVRLTDARARLLAAGVDVIDFGIGEPREETPPFLREAVARAIEPVSRYPLAEGLPELRAAIAGWAARRFGVALDPDTEIVPTLGSKEAVFHLAAALGGELVVVPQPAYPVYERGAVFAGKSVHEVPLRAADGFLPDLDAVPADVWARTAILWLNYPNNPTAAARSYSDSGAPRWRASSTSWWRATRRTRSCTSARRRCPGCRSATGRTWRSSTRSRSGRRCPATGRASWRATPNWWRR